MAAGVAVLAVRAVTPEEEFWHRFLSAELPSQKCQAILKELGTSGSLSVGMLLRQGSLSDRERGLIRNADVLALKNVLLAGARLVRSDELGEMLQQAMFAPPAVFIKGDESCLFAPTVAIVGTRRASTYGKAVAQKFAEAFARAGMTVVSGGAYGIDASAHRGALAVGGKTAAVLLTAIDRVFPREHAGLFQQIGASGCLLSQFAPGSRDSNYRPLIRNLTVAALSHAVVVIEAPQKSGALSTAAAANELGRQVFVVPANIENENFRGSHALIRDGATLVDHPDHVLMALGIQPGHAIVDVESLTPAQEQIMAILTTSPLAAEFIAERTGIGNGEVLGELTLLELEGKVVRDLGGYARRP